MRCPEKTILCCCYRQPNFCRCPLWLPGIDSPLSTHNHHLAKPRSGAAQQAFRYRRHKQAWLNRQPTLPWWERRESLSVPTVDQLAANDNGGSHGGEEVDCCLFVCCFGCRHLHICHFYFPSTLLLSLPSLSPLSVSSLRVLCLLSQLTVVYVRVMYVRIMFWWCVVDDEHGCCPDMIEPD